MRTLSELKTRECVICDTQEKFNSVISAITENCLLDGTMWGFFDSNTVVYPTEKWESGQEQFTGTYGDIEGANERGDLVYKFEEIEL